VRLQGVCVRIAPQQSLPHSKLSKGGAARPACTAPRIEASDYSIGEPLFEVQLIGTDWSNQPSGKSCMSRLVYLTEGLLYVKEMDPIHIKQIDHTQRTVGRIDLQSASSALATTSPTRRGIETSRSWVVMCLSRQQYSVVKRPASSGDPEAKVRVREPPLWTLRLVDAFACFRIDASRGQRMAIESLERGVCTCLQVAPYTPTPPRMRHAVLSQRSSYAHTSQVTIEGQDMVLR
jgi:hypothetical protein